MKTPAKTASHYMVRDRWATRAGEWVLFALAWTFRVVTWPVPTWTLAGALAPVGGWVALGLPGVHRRAAQNLIHVWPELPAPRRREIVRGAGVHFLRLVIEYSRLPRLEREAEIHVNGAGHLEGQSGIVFVTAHFGNWEAARLAALNAGQETGIIYRAFNNRYLDRFVQQHIRAAGSPVLHKGREGMRRLVRHVKGGGNMMILVDQRNSGAPFLDFLGQPAETVTAAADLALRSGAALIPVRATRDVAARRFYVEFEAPIARTDARTMMEEVNRRIGAWVTETPEQWFWFHRRWRTTSRSRQAE